MTMQTREYPHAIHTMDTVHHRTLYQMTMKSTQRARGHSHLRSLARSYHSFACSALLAAVICSHAHSLTLECVVYKMNASISSDFNPRSVGVDKDAITCNYMQLHAITRNYMQLHAITCNYIDIDLCNCND